MGSYPPYYELAPFGCCPRCGFVLGREGGVHRCNSCHWTEAPPAPDTPLPPRADCPDCTEPSDVRGMCERHRAVLVEMLRRA